MKARKQTPVLNLPSKLLEGVARQRVEIFNFSEEEEGGGKIENTTLDGKQPLLMYTQRRLSG